MDRVGNEVLACIYLVLFALINMVNELKSAG